MSSKGKILAVDDEDGITEYLSFLLDKAGFEVKTAQGGWEAWDLISAEPFDFVLTDVRMDHGDGIELVEKIRKMNSPKPRIAIMSAFSDFSISDIFDRGAIGLIQKPPDSARLIEFVIDSLRSPLQKWGQAPTLKTDTKLDLMFPSYEKAFESGKISIGSGGMFIQTDDKFLLIDSVVEFNLKFASGSPSILNGYGYVRWVRGTSQRLFYSGIGLEFTTLEAKTRDFINSNLEQNHPQSYIPVGLAPGRTG